MKTCLQCGTSMEGRRKDAVYCSGLCRGRYRMGSDPTSKRTDCEYCHGPLRENAPLSTRFCSARCQRRQKAGLPYQPARSCGVCGNSLVDRKLGAKYCSDRCANAARNLGKDTQRACPICQTRFTPRNGSHRFCSTACYNASKRSSGDKTPFTPQYVPCAQCGTAFFADTITDKYCSNACYVLGRRAANRRTKKAHKAAMISAWNTKPACPLGHFTTREDHKCHVRGCEHSVYQLV